MDRPIRWQMDNQICYAYEAVRAASSALHGHHHFLLTLITQGNGVQILNGKHIPFQPGDIFFLSPADFHKNILEEGEKFSYYGVKFTYDLLDARLFEVLALDKLPLHVHLQDKTAAIAKNIFIQMVQECQDGQSRIGNRVYLQALMEQLVILILREMKQDHFVRPTAFLNRALGYLYSHFSEQITVLDAANYVGYSPNYFNTCFSRYMGLPFHEYLGQMRLDYAKSLLLSSTLSATEVAWESGFGSLSYFSRCFQKKYQMSPREYRKHHQEHHEPEVLK